MGAWFIYALGAMICYGLADVFYKRAAVNGVSTRHFLMVQAWIFTSSVTVYTIAAGKLDGNAGAAWGCVAGVLVFVALYNFASSLGAGKVSVIAPTFRMNFVVTAIVAAIILDEELNRYKFAAIALAASAAWILLGAASEDDNKTHRSVFGQLFLATVAMGMANFVYKLGLRAGALPEMILLAQAIVFVSLATAYVYLTSRSIMVPRGTVVFAAPAAFLLIVAFLTMIQALAHGDVSKVVPVAQTGFLVSSLAGIVLFDEPWGWRQFAGLSLTVLALALFNAS